MRSLSLSDLSLARRKAAQRLGTSNKRCWPDNSEIQAALEEEYRLFEPDTQQRVTRQLREHALAAMATFATFRPRLVGPAVTGTATLEQGISLHLFADDVREILFRLVDNGIPWREGQCQKRYSNGSRQDHPSFTFVAGEVPIELIVLPPRTRHNPPLCAIFERPERGLGRADLEDLLAQEPAPLDL